MSPSLPPKWHFLYHCLNQDNQMSEELFQNDQSSLKFSFCMYCFCSCKHVNMISCCLWNRKWNAWIWVPASSVIFCWDHCEVNIETHCSRFNLIYQECAFAHTCHCNVFPDEAALCCSKSWAYRNLFGGWPSVVFAAAPLHNKQSSVDWIMWYKILAQSINYVLKWRCYILVLHIKG